MAQARPPCPKVVAIPAGWRRALPKEVTPTVQRAAVTALRQALPIAKLQVTEVNGRMFGFLTEWHYDDHCTKPGNPIWHPGISTIVAIKEPPKVNPAAVQQLIASTMTYEPSPSGYSTVAGEDDSHLDAVMGADFGEEHNDDESDFGAVMTGRASARGTVSLNAQLKAKTAAAAKAKAARDKAARDKAAANARAAANAKTAAARARAAQAKAKPTPSAARTTPTRTDSPTGPAAKAPVRATGYMPFTPEAPEAPQADEAAFDEYVMPSEETPETADEGSESYDESAIGAEFNISG